ncbi:MAG: hypothetical protein ABEJ65_05230 [bacterium]
MTLLSPLVPVVWILGIQSIESNDVKSHQFRMLTGYGILIFILLLYWGIEIGLGVHYKGYYREAFRLTSWIQRGLGSASLVLGGLALWGMNEGAWQLHRRAGMFTLLSGSVSALSSSVLSIMILTS